MSNLQVVHGLLKKSSQRETLAQYEKIFFADNVAYKKKDIMSLLQKDSPPPLTKRPQPIDYDPDLHEEKPALFTEKIDSNTRAFSRTRIRELTGYSYFTKVKHSATPVYIGWQETFSNAISEGKHDVYVLDGSRQMGKSLITAQMLIEYSFLPNFDSLVASFEAKSTQRILNYIKKYTKNLDESLFSIHKQDGYIENTFSGSKIYFSTLSEDGDKVRGLTLSLVVIDEAQLVDIETMESGVLPTLSTTG